MAGIAPLQLLTDLSPVEDIVLNANFDEVKKGLTETMEVYRNIVVTEESIQSAKADRAKINNVSKQIDEFRRTIKKIYSEPVAVFEKKCKELTEICDNASNNLDTQIKSFENDEKNRKIERLKEFFNENNETDDMLSWDSVFDPRWGNKTFPEAEAEQTILDKIEKAKQDVEAIRLLGSDQEAALLLIYRQTGNLSYCIQKNEELKKLAEIAKRRNEEEERRKAEEQQKEEQYPKPDPEKEEEILTATFKVKCTKVQLLELKYFLVSHNIEFSKP